MTLFSDSKSNSVVAEYDGDTLDIMAMNDDGENKKIYVTQLTSDDIRDMLARPASSTSLDKRLQKDFKCNNHSFRSPTIRHHRRYPKSLMSAIKTAEMIASVPLKNIRQTKRNRRKGKKKLTTRGKRQKRKRRTTRRNVRKRSPTKTMRYTPYPSTTEIITNDPLSDNSKTIPFDRLSEEMPETIRELISRTSRDNKSPTLPL